METFQTKTEIVKALVVEWGYRTEQFYNTPTNKQNEKFWTYNRCLKHLYDLRKNYIRTEHGIMHKSLADTSYKWEY